MKQAVGIVQEISWQVDCPECGETSYSDIDPDGWGKLEYGDGHPYGELKCSSCLESFYVTIED